MFKLEKEMIPILKKYLSCIYGIDYFVDEFNSWMGIADLVFTSEKIEKKRKFLLDYELTYIIQKYINRKGKVISLEYLCKHTGISKKKAKILIEFLLDSHVLENINKSDYLVVWKYSPPIKKMISIEAKLSDWKGWMYQAIRYKTYSHRSYLAISEEYAHRVDLEMLKENNIWLICVSPSSLKFKLRVNDELPKNPVAYSYLSEKMAHTLFA